MGGDLNKVTFELVLEQRMVLLAENGGWGSVFSADRTACIMVKNQIASPRYGDNLDNTKIRLEREFMKALECQAKVFRLNSIGDGS